MVLHLSALLVTQVAATQHDPREVTSLPELGNYKKTTIMLLGYSRELGDNASYPFKAQQILYVPPALTFKKYRFLPR
jgi:hypothetical protein